MMTTQRAWLTAICLMLTMSLAARKASESLKVMQLNLWMGGNTVPNGTQMIVDRVADYDPDILLVCEVTQPQELKKWFAEGMRKYKRHYFFANEGAQMVISKFPCLSSRYISGAGFYAVLNANGRKIHVGSMHLYYMAYACYLPRGYHGDTWKRIKPVSDVNEVIDMNLRSKRYQAVQRMIKATEQARKNGELVILGGDFNEPSHLDWTERTKNLYDHNGIVMKWHSTKALEDAGFQDAYRLKHPDELKYPAFTFPINNTAVPVAKLTWAPLADERDRIDFIFFNKNAPVTLTRAAIIGPRTTILKAKRDTTPQPGDYIPHDTNWPTDHAGNIAEFTFRK